jgi:hypothetical protein
LRPKTGWLLFGQLVRRKIIFFQFFLLDEWIAYFTSFPWTPSTFNSDSVWARAEFLLKQVLSSFFLYFLRSSYQAAQGLKGKVLRKKLFLPIKFWFFTFFHFFFCSCFCMMSPLMWPLQSKCKVFYFFKVHSVEVLSQNPRQEK